MWPTAIRCPSKRATVAVVLVPLRAGSWSTWAAIDSWASCSPSVTRVSRSAEPGRSSSWRSSLTAVLDAMSPRAAPPTPSQTASSHGPA